MASMYDDSNIPRWKKMGLTDDDIRSLQGKNRVCPYDGYGNFIVSQTHRHRDLSGELKNVFIYFEKGLCSSEVARIINTAVSDLEECLHKNGYFCDDCTWVKLSKKGMEDVESKIKSYNERIAEIEIEISKTTIANAQLGKDLLTLKQLRYALGGAP